MRPLQGIVCILFYSTFLTGGAFAQTSSLAEVADLVFNELSKTETKVLGDFDNSGELNVFQMNYPYYFDRRLRLLENKEFQKELDVTESQMQKIGAMVSRWNISHSKLMSDLERLYERSFEKQEYDALMRKFRELEKSNTEAIKGILLPHQEASLSQIHMRFVARRIGCLQFLNTKAVQTYAKLSPRDLHEIRFAAMNHREKLLKLVEKAQDESIDLVLSALPEGDKALILEKWPRLTDSSKRTFARFPLHLGMPEEITSLSDFDTPIERLTNFPRFILSASGEFESSGSSPNSGQEKYPTVLAFFEIANKAQGIRALAISDRQLQVIDDSALAFKQAVANASQIGFEYDGSDGTTAQEMRSRVRQLRMDASINAYDSIRSTISTSQWEKFESICELALEKKLGPFWDLQYGQLGDAILPDRAKLQGLVSKAKTAYKASTIEIEDEWLSTILSCITEEQQDKILEVLGPQMKNTQVNLSVYLIESMRR